VHLKGSNDKEATKPKGDFTRGRTKTWTERKANTKREEKSTQEKPRTERCWHGLGGTKKFDGS